MLLITTIDMLPTFTEADLRYLANLKTTDRMVVLSKEGATMPVNLFKALSALKCSLEIKEIDTKDLFTLGYAIGSLTTAAGNEKVTILMNKEYPMEAKNVTWASSLSGAKSAAGVKASPKSASRQVAKETQEATTKEALKVSKKGKATVSEDVAKASVTKKTVRSRKPKSMVDILLAYPELKKYKKIIETSEEAIAQAIIAASDAEIGFPFQLQLRGFGDEKDAIAQAIKKDFARIKEQLGKA